MSVQRHSDSDDPIFQTHCCVKSGREVDVTRKNEVLTGRSPDDPLVESCRLGFQYTQHDFRCLWMTPDTGRLTGE